MAVTLTFLLASAVALVGLAQAPRAFAFVPHYRMVKTALGTAPLQLSQKLSEIDKICIENVAEFCLQADVAVANAAGCDVEEYTALVNQLRDQRVILADHLAYVDSLLLKLQASGSKATFAKEEETYFPG